MKTWTTPEFEELEIRLTAYNPGNGNANGNGKGDGNHCEEHWPGNGHSGACTPDCDHYNGDTPIYPDPGTPIS